MTFHETNPHQHNNHYEGARNVASRTAKGVIGTALVLDATLLGMSTYDAMNDKSTERPTKLYFQQEIKGDDEETYSNAEISSGIALNVIAVGGLAAAGVTLVRRAVRPDQNRD